MPRNPSPDDIRTFRGNRFVFTIGFEPLISSDTEGDAAVGFTVTITMMSKEAGKDGPKYSPEILQMGEPKYFHWRAHMMAGFIFTNDKIIELEKTDTGTKVTHKETFKGLMAALMKGQMEKGVPPMLNTMNEALKKQAEQEELIPKHINWLSPQNR